MEKVPIAKYYPLDEEEYEFKSRNHGLESLLHPLNNRDLCTVFVFVEDEKYSLQEDKGVV